MNVELKDYDTGWISVAICLKGQDLQNLIHSLSALQEAEVGQHFHLANREMVGDTGIVHIEFARDSENAEDTFDGPTSFAKGENVT